MSGSRSVVILRDIFIVTSPPLTSQRHTPIPTDLQAHTY